MLKFIIVYSSWLVVIQAFAFPSLKWARDVDTEWHGKWFPYEPGATEDNNIEEDFDDGENADPESNTDTGHSMHSMSMGIPSDTCDDAKFNLMVDWDNSPINFTCYDSKLSYLPNPDVHPLIHCDHIPKYYHAEHICMNFSIEYDDELPTFGPHRPLWAKYGEYLFLPKQRWIHNLEHGAVVVLYHPCANKNEVLFLKHLVEKCLYRYIVTPYTLLPPNRPLALLTWGCRFLMSKVDPLLVVKFILNTALQGPEHISDDGQFDFGLLQSARFVSDVDDSLLCPKSSLMI